MFFINDKAGVAFERNEAGVVRFSPEDKDFTVVASAEERAKFAYGPGIRRVMEEEALAFMEAKLASSGTVAPAA